MTTQPVWASSRAELIEAYRAGTVTPLEVTDLVLEVARTRGRELEAVAAVDVEPAREAARASGRRWASGTPIGPLDGIPVSIKDSFPMVGVPRWHGSALNDGQPSVRDGAPVRRLRQAGAVLFATTAMPDFGLLGSGRSSQFGTTRNPWNPDLNPGGSSSGSAALLAIGCGPLSVGTDVAGSVRLPAALCGLAALKPTQGRVAYDPPKLVGGAGPMGRTVDDIAALLQVIGRPDVSDHLSLPGRFCWDGDVPERLDGLRVGVLLATDVATGVHPEVSSAVATAAGIYAGLGASVTALDGPLLSAADRRVFENVVLTRALPELLAVPEDRWSLLPAPLLARLAGRLSVLAHDHVRDERTLETVRARMAATIERFDVVLSPMTPFLSFPADALQPHGERWTFDHLTFTIPFNLTSFPAGTVPVALSTTGLPIGVQVAAPRFRDGQVLSLLAVLERERRWTPRFPSAPPPR